MPVSTEMKTCAAAAWRMHPQTVLIFRLTDEHVALWPSGNNEAMPPAESDLFIKRLVAQGHRVAVCDPVEER